MKYKIEKRSKMNKLKFVSLKHLQFCTVFNKIHLLKIGRLIGTTTIQNITNEMKIRKFPINFRVNTTLWRIN